MQAILNIAIRAARKAGAHILREHLRLNTNFSHENVHKLQIQAETMMIDIIQKAYPEHGVVTTNTDPSEAETVWHIELVSGFENLLRNIPHYALVIVIAERQKPRYTLVYDPNTEEIFTAVAGGGAQCNDYRLRTNKCGQLQGALLATSTLTLQAGELKVPTLLTALSAAGSSFYNQGCAALSLAYVAAGRLDGFFGVGLSKIVLNAGLLLLNETGALVSDWQVAHQYLEKLELLTANPKLFKLLAPRFKEIMQTT